MKSNGLSLATIAVLCSGVILTIAMGMSIGQGIKDSIIENDYELVYGLEKSLTEEKALEDKIHRYDEKLPDDVKRKYFPYLTNRVRLDHEGSVEFLHDFKMFNENEPFATISTAKYYEEAFSERLPELKEDEIYYTTSIHRYHAFKEMKIADKVYKVKEFEIKDQSAKNIAIDTTFILVKDHKALEEILHFMRKEAPDTNLYLRILANDSPGTNHEKNLQAFAKEQGGKFFTQRENQEFIEGFAGGFLYLGIMISIVLTIMSSLILYYKQIVEGHHDQKQFAILKKLGISEKMAIETIGRQMRSVFLFPIIVAVIHNLVASKIMAQLLRLFKIRSYLIYFQNLLLVSIAFIAVYVICYKIAQNAYRKIVWSK
ncbi:MAG: hypothetical protein Q4P28_03955 [Tissierellia bacterium]|nr:hypothetical protein [Tissierellia bacterium]